MKDGSFGSFSQYVSTALGYWCISMPVDSSDWPNAKCTCPAYLKNYVCKHNTEVSLLKKYASKAIPFAAKTLPLGQKRGRGRPSLALSSLMRQPNIYASILDEDAPEDNDDVDNDASTVPAPLSEIPEDDELHDLLNLERLLVTGATAEQPDVEPKQPSTQQPFTQPPTHQLFTQQPPTHQLFTQQPQTPTTQQPSTQQPRQLVKRCGGRPKGSLNKKPSKKRHVTRLC